MNRDLDHRDGPRDECGVFGVFAPERDVARLAYFALYVETIFGVPGVGSLTASTIGTFDLPPIVALAIYLAIVVVFASALVDIAVAWLDPRIRRPRAST